MNPHLALTAEANFGTKIWNQTAPNVQVVAQAAEKLGEPSGIRTLDPLIKSPFERYFAGRAPDHSFALHLQYLPEIPEELPTPAPTWSVTHCAQR